MDNMNKIKKWIMISICCMVGFVPSVFGAQVLSEFQITTDANTQWRPAIDRDYVVWQDQRNGNADIYGYNLATDTEFPICTDAFNQEHPIISGDIVVWYDWRNGNADIYGYNLQTDTEFEITTDASNQRLPVISGDYVVWNDWRNGNWDIYGYNLATDTEFPICTNATHQYFPQVSGNYVVWWDERNGIGNWDIYGYDLPTGTEFPICTDPNNQGYPAVGGNFVAYIDDRNGNWDIYGYDLSTGTEFPICTDTSDQFRPRVYNDIVVWFDLRNGNQDIYGYRFSTAEEFQITTDASDQRHHKIYCDTVVWHDRRDGDYNIYGANLDTQQCFSITLISPKGGEVISSASSWAIQWVAPLEAVGFKLKYSMDNGTTWKRIDSGITDTIYGWTVPTPPKNKKRCLVMVIGYDDSGAKVGADRSDSTFTIEVVKLTSPDGGETLTGGGLHTITWQTNVTKNPVETVKLKYTKNGGTTWLPIDILTGGDPGTYDWTVPDVPKTKAKCKVKVILKDANGKTVGKGTSDGYFTIEPAP